MNHQNFFLTIFVGAVMALTAGCDDSGSGGEPTATSTATSTGTGTGTSTGGVLLKADTGGFVAKDSNSLGIQGAWYPYGDNLGPTGMPPGNCQNVGMHPATECASVTKPAPGMPFAPSDATDDQKLCTEGTVEAVGMLNGSPDYGNQWGAGIGLDFNNPGMGAPKGGFNAMTAGVTGISFDIDMLPLAPLRVEIPDAATNGKAAAYWGGDANYGPSPVKQGTNTFTWEQVTPPGMPGTVPALDKTQLYGLQFHVVSGAAGPYKFCISHVKLLK